MRPSREGSCPCHGGRHYDATPRFSASFRHLHAAERVCRLEPWLTLAPPLRELQLAQRAVADVIVVIRPRAPRVCLPSAPCDPPDRGHAHATVGTTLSLLHDVRMWSAYASRLSLVADIPEQRPWPSRPGEFHPEPLTEPDLTLSRHPARAIARRLPPSIEHRVPPVAG
jgi:hypothetical protein